MKFDETGTRLISIEPEDLNEDGSFVVPDGVTHIGDGAFQDCSSLTQINLPDGVTHIGEEAFQDCSSLTQINLPDSVTHIGDGAFYDCSSLTQIKLPETITHIGNWAFAGCSSLTQIKLPDRITHIKDQAFADCHSLTQIDLPDGVTHIEVRAFKFCISLTQINLPKTITHIEDGAFFSCSGLTQIKLPETITHIGNWAFAGCSSLTQIKLPDSVTRIEDGAFNGCKALIAINTEDPDQFASIRDLVPQESRTRVLPMKIVGNINDIQQQAITQVLYQRETSALYRFVKNQSITQLPIDIHAHINSYLVNDNPYLKKLTREMAKVPFPNSEEDIPRYQSNIQSLAQDTCDAAIEIFPSTNYPSRNTTFFTAIRQQIDPAATSPFLQPSSNKYNYSH